MKFQQQQQIDINQPNINQSFIQIPVASEPIDILMSNK
jgi:hypothetical protein